MKGATDTFAGEWLAQRALLPTAAGDPWAVNRPVTEGKPLSRRLRGVRFGGTVSAPFSDLTPARHGALSHHAPLGKVSLFLSAMMQQGSPTPHLSTFHRTADSLLTLEYSEPNEQQPGRCVWFDVESSFSTKDVWKFGSELPPGTQTATNHLTRTPLRNPWGWLSAAVEDWCGPSSQGEERR